MPPAFVGCTSWLDGARVGTFAVLSVKELVEGAIYPSDFRVRTGMVSEMHLTEPNRQSLRGLV